MSTTADDHRVFEPNRNRNLSLFGAPGSGKGSYGKHFAKALNLPLVTTSDVLRNLRPDLVASMSDGKLVDDAVVGETVLEGLLKLHATHQGTSNDRHNRGDGGGGGGGYILDGFPRTLRQVALMEETWPEFLRIRSVVHLGVPDFVCSAKLLGRRACSRCGRSYNVHGVDRDGWTLPPHLPREGEACGGDPAGTTPGGCDHDVRRDDDTPGVVEERLRIYHEHADPILDHVRDREANGGRYRLLTLKPYRGFDDVPRLVEQLRGHISSEGDE